MVLVAIPNPSLLPATERRLARGRSLGRSGSRRSCDSWIVIGGVGAGSGPRPLSPVRVGTLGNTRSRAV